MALHYSINQYIAQYLQAEGECALPYWGILRVKHMPAEWHNEHLHSPIIQFDWKADSAIDTHFIYRLANETATNQAIVESAYAQWLKQVQQTLSLGKEYGLAEIGFWQQQQNGVSWRTSNLFNARAEVSWPEGLLLTGENNLHHELGSENNQSNSSNNWLYITLACLLLMLAGGLYWYNQNKLNYPINEPAEITHTLVTDTSHQVTLPKPVPDTNTPPATQTSLADSNRFDVVVYHFSSEAKAIKQANKLVRNGNDSRVVMRADSQYQVVVRAITMQPDTQRIVDSIRLFFNPKGRLYILK